LLLAELSASVILVYNVCMLVTLRNYMIMCAMVNVPPNLEGFDRRFSGIYTLSECEVLTPVSSLPRVLPKDPIVAAKS
jgi:hypothetical protein